MYLRVRANCIARHVYQRAHLAAEFEASAHNLDVLIARCYAL